MVKRFLLQRLNSYVSANYKFSNDFIINSVKLHTLCTTFRRGRPQQTLWYVMKRNTQALSNTSYRHVSCWIIQLKKANLEIFVFISGKQQFDYQAWPQPYLLNGGALWGVTHCALTVACCFTDFNLMLFSLKYRKILCCQILPYQLLPFKRLIQNWKIPKIFVIHKYYNPNREEASAMTPISQAWAPKLSRSLNYILCLK